MTSYYAYDRSLRGLRLLTPPIVEPVTLGRAKQHLRIESAFTADDDYIGALISAARQWIEAHTRRALCNQQWRMTLDRFPAWGDGDDQVLFWWWRRGIIDLIKPPIVSIDALRYTDVNGTTGTLVQGTDFNLDIESDYARIEPVWGQSWPFTRFQMATVQIDHTSGYTNQAGDPGNAIPGPIKAAILLLLGHLYENREQVSGMPTYEMPFGVQALVAPYRSLRMP